MLTNISLLVFYLQQLVIDFWNIICNYLLFGLYLQHTSYQTNNKPYKSRSNAWKQRKFVNGQQNKIKLFLKAFWPRKFCLSLNDNRYHQLKMTNNYKFLTSTTFMREWRQNCKKFVLKKYPPPFLSYDDKQMLWIRKSLLNSNF